MSKRLMILGAGILQIPLIQQAKAMGLTTIVVSPNPEEAGCLLADYYIQADVKDTKRILFEAKKLSIDGIITDQTDLPVITIAEVAHQLNLPGNDLETIHFFRNKFLMRQKCKELGIKTQEYAVVGEIEEARIFFRQINKPIIVKPLDSQGSRGVHKISSLEELDKYFPIAQAVSESQSVLIEEFLNGSEFLVEGIVLNYEFQNLICGDSIPFALDNVFSASRREFPSIAAQGIINKILSLNERIIKSFGLKQGITHSEFIVSDGEVYLIEVAARGGGVFISSDLINICTGLNTEKFIIEMALGEVTELPKITYLAKSCCYKAFYLPKGIISNAKNIDLVQALPYVRRNNLDQIEVGQKGKGIEDKTQRYFFVLEADNHEDLNTKIEFIKNLLEIEIETDKGTLYPIWE